MGYFINKPFRYWKPERRLEGLFYWTGLGALAFIVAHRYNERKRGKPYQGRKNDEAINETQSTALE